MAKVKNGIGPFKWVCVHGPLDEELLDLVEAGVLVTLPRSAQHGAQPALLMTPHKESINTHWAEMLSKPRWHPSILNREDIKGMLFGISYEMTLQ